MKNLSITSVPHLGELEVEVVERKGIGHPDTIADALAENLSVAYSHYTLEHFGVILHHNFDKLSVLGGTTEVDFGEGKLTSPIRVILNGRVSIRFAGKDIPIRDILELETHRFFSALFGDSIDAERDVEIYWFVSSASSPGKTKRTTGTRANIFTPRNISEVKGYDLLLNNDTSMGCGYAPLSLIEVMVLTLEDKLNSSAMKQKHPWLGTDIKVMSVRVRNQCGVTICLPQIARYVSSLDVYQDNLTAIRLIIKTALEELLPSIHTTLSTNMRDNLAQGDVYLTVIGSSIESGDEGVVGRGNRINGIITPLRPINLEGACGKNPKYWTGKLYNVAARTIAERLYGETQSACEVFLVSQTGQPVIEPWHTLVSTAETSLDEKHIERIVEEELTHIPQITEALLERKVRLY